jgi:hypothetical protein
VRERVEPEGRERWRDKSNLDMVCMYIKVILDLS